MHDRVAASRWSAIEVRMVRERQWSKSAPGSTSGEAFVQSVVSEIRFEIAEPSPAGLAAQVRALVSSTHPPLASAIMNDEKYGSR